MDSLLIIFIIITSCIDHVKVMSRVELIKNLMNSVSVVYLSKSSLRVDIVIGYLNRQLG